MIELELARYRTPGRDNERYDYDESFKTYYHDCWLYDERVNQFSVGVVYDRTRSGHAKVPPCQEHGPVVGELKTLVEKCPVEWFESNFAVRARPGSTNQPIELRRTYDRPDARFSTECFPLLASHFREVALTFHPSIRLGTLGSDLNSAFVGVDIGEVVRLVSKKLRAVASRAITGRELWLLIHSDGWPLSACVGSDEQLAAALKATRALGESDGRTARVDRIWWMNDTLIDSSRRIYSVWSKD